jgi:negative regulator of flagellin synthesis FlgM
MSSDIRGVRGGGPSVTQLGTAGGRPGPLPVRDATARDVPSDRFSLTASARTLQRGAQALEQVPIVDLGRVSTVRESLASGAYEVNPQRVANKLIELELMLPEFPDADEQSA